jgi:hypothetical protein
MMLMVRSVLSISIQPRLMPRLIDIEGFNTYSYIVKMLNIDAILGKEGLKQFQEVDDDAQRIF